MVFFMMHVEFEVHSQTNLLGYHQVETGRGWILCHGCHILWPYLDCHKDEVYLATPSFGCITGFRILVSLLSLAIVLHAFWNGFCAILHTERNFP